MLLKTLKLSNFRQFKNVDIAFPSGGCIGIYGANGAGKSNLLEGVSWLLFGNDAFSESKEMVRNTQADGQSVLGELQFDLNGSAYLLRRGLSAMLKPDAELYCDGALVAKKADAVTSHVKTLLNMDWETFRISINCQQKEINVLSKLKPAERREAVLRMLGLNKLDSVVSDVRSDLRFAKRELESATSRTFVMSGAELDTSILQYQDAHVQWTKHLADLNKQACKCNDDLQLCLSTRDQGEMDLEADIAIRDAAIALLQQEINRIDIQLSSYKTTTQSLGKQLTMIKQLGASGQCPTCMNTMGEKYSDILLSIQIEYDRIVKKIDDINTDRTAVVVQYNTSANDRGVVEAKLRARQQESQNKRQQLGLEMHDTQQKINDAYRSQQQVIIKLQELVSIKSQYDQVQGLIKQHSEQQANLAKLDKAMVDFRAFMIAQICPALSSNASSLLDSLSDGKYSQLRVTDDYDIMVDTDGVEYPINHYSGGEEDLFNICLRLAISRIIIERAGHSIGFLFLDEILSALDSERISLVMKMLNDYAQNIGQIFIVTHQPSISDLLSSRIDIINNENGGVAYVV